MLCETIELKEPQIGKDLKPSPDFSNETCKGSARTHFPVGHRSPVGTHVFTDRIWVQGSEARGSQYKSEGSAGQGGPWAPGLLAWKWLPCVTEGWRKGSRILESGSLELGAFPWSPT